MARRKTYQKPEPYEENGQWKIKYRVPVEQEDGSIRREQRTKCLGSVAEMTPSEARKERDRFLQPINDVAPGVEHSRKTMAQLIARWRTSVRPTLKHSTQCSYGWAFKRIEPAFGTSPVASIGKADVQAFLTNAATRLAPQSVRDLHARLQGLFSVAEDWAWIPKGSNPASGRFRFPEKVPKRPRVVIWPEQLWALAPELPQPYRTTVLLAVLGGLRRGELEALRWRDNAEPGKLTVDEANYRGVLGTPKTRTSRRVVDLVPEAQRAVDEWRVRAKFPRGGRLYVRNPNQHSNRAAQRCRPIHQASLPAPGDTGHILARPQAQLHDLGPAGWPQSRVAP
jgi:integrase